MFLTKMFLNTKILLITFSLFAITGCIRTDTQSDQAKNTNMDDSLATSQMERKKLSSDLSIAQNALKMSEDKIVALTIALEKSKKVTPTANPVKSKKVIHLDEKSILGQSEWVYVSKVKQNYKGRIDTGAATSSINAVDIERFERDGKKWVRFNITHTKEAKAEMVEAKIVRIAKITQSSKPGVETERPVVKLHVRIGDVVHLTEFTLTNRLHMEYPVLIGRTFMQDIVLVDVSKEYIFPKYQVPAKK